MFSGRRRRSTGPTALASGIAIIVSAVALAASQGAVAVNTLTPAERAAGWKLLFDGNTLTGWRGYDAKRDFTKSWGVVDGALKNSRTDGRPNSGGGDIVTTEQFTDFEFRFEWRVSRAGNSGIKYFVHERIGAPGAPMYVGDDGVSAVGHEYQVLDDDEHPDAKNGPIRQAGSLYSLFPPNNAKRLKPVGEFNDARLLVQGKHVEHWLNGAKVVEYDLESPALMKAIAASKYKDIPRFGTKFSTRLLIQDHGDDVWFRNLKIRPLPPA
jgi:hypothetical protein